MNINKSVLASDGVDIGEEFGSPIGRTINIGDLVSNFLQAAIVVAGLIMIFLFVFGGISMIAGAGQNNPESVAKGKKALTAALIGFIIIFTSIWIVRIIEIITGDTFLTNPSIWTSL
ncbi:MAG: hypothetical protein BMS9Abin21_232 [Thermodesulfovibrionia bacterium]|nr:MAG: hypothetical protein BMS9Abin21_232 [Thermodesulfovibrionia bacterium]